MIEFNFDVDAFFQDAVHIRPTTIQTARAANLVCSAFRYRTELDHENIKPVRMLYFSIMKFQCIQLS